jgi:hypothetical protein
MQHSPANKSLIANLAQSLCGADLKAAGRDNHLMSFLLRDRTYFSELGVNPVCV